MADAVISPVEFDVGGGPVHQVLHGYSEGHKLLESSIQLPDDISRLMLRLSDLSGSNVTSGFEDYLTGYPLGSSGLYALAKTWHAPEVPRPGCVWTHTLLLTKEHLGLPSLFPFLALFRRPKHREAKGAYQLPIQNSDSIDVDPPELRSGDPETLPKLLATYYRKPARPVLVPGQASTEYTRDIFSLWAQQWPILRRELTFSTGSLSARTLGSKPFDLQCVPVNLVRDVQLEMQSSPGAEPVILSSGLSELPSFASLLADDAIQPVGGPLRAFLWAAAEPGSTRSDFLIFAEVFSAIERSDEIDVIVTLLVDNFPSVNQAINLKQMLFGERTNQPYLKHADEIHVLATLGVTEHFSAFDAANLKLRERGEALSSDPNAARWVIDQLFRSPLNPLGGEILVGLIGSLDPQTARAITVEQPQFLSTLVDVKPSLAASPQLWIAADGRKRELFSSLERQERLAPDVIAGVIHAMLDSQSDHFLPKAFKKWGTAAVFASLDWIDKKQGPISYGCRNALSDHLVFVVDWLENAPPQSTATIIELAKIVGPRAQPYLHRDAKVWECALEVGGSQLNRDDRLYLAALLLAMGLNNAPPHPLTIIKKTFEPIYCAAWDNQITDSAWEILDPLFEHLPWPNGWDKCERMSRGLVHSFVKYRWPREELATCISDPVILARVIKSGRKVQGGAVFEKGSRKGAGL